MKPIGYKNILRKKLADDRLVAEYLTACREEGLEVFLIGLNDVIDAQKNSATFIASRRN